MPYNITKMYILSAKVLGIATLLLNSVLSREIIFPPVIGANVFQASLGHNVNDVDIITGSQFSGLTTFAHFPYLACFDGTSTVQAYDIALLGAPFDTVSATEGMILSYT